MNNSTSATGVLEGEVRVKEALSFLCKDTVVNLLKLIKTKLWE